MKRLYVVETKQEALDMGQVLPDGWRAVTPGAKMSATQMFDEVTLTLTRQPTHEDLRWFYTHVLLKLKPPITE